MLTIPALAMATGLLGAILPSAAFAETAGAASDVDLQVYAANSASNLSLEGAVVSVLFAVVVFLLVIVTGGVAYINIKQWLDSRQEQEDQQKLKPSGFQAPSAAPAKEKPTVVDEDVIVPLKRANRIKKEKGKGFAAADFTTRRPE